MVGVLIERIIGGPIDLVTVEHTESSVACVELLGDLLVNLRLLLLGLTRTCVKCNLCNIILLDQQLGVCHAR